MDKILVVDSERAIRNILKETLEYEKYEVTVAESCEKGRSLIEETSFNLVITDVKMECKDGLEFLDYIMNEEDRFHMPVIVVSADGNIDLAVNAIKRGAFDFIEKPIDISRLLSTVKNALQKRELVKDAKKIIRKKGGSKNQQDTLIGVSEQLKNVKRMISKVAPSEARVLILGDNGTGKELVAREIHKFSHRAAESFIEVNCAAIPSELIESEMFGHEKGAFTSAIKQRKGKFEQAIGGTLFLDEIGDLSLSAQAKLLRALQEKKICRVGGDKDIDIDVRVLAATNKNLKEEIRNGNFREDLYHRLAVVIIQVPPLRERREDIPILINNFISKSCEAENKKPREITPDAVDMLVAMEWSGNVRELLNVVERLLVFTDDENKDEAIITAEDVKMYVLDFQ